MKLFFIFFFESDYKSYFAVKTKCYCMIIVLTWIRPRFDYHYHCPPYGLAPGSPLLHIMKKTLSSNDMSFLKLKSPIS